MVIFFGLILSGMEGVACLRHWVGLSLFCFLSVTMDGSALRWADFSLM